MKLDEKTEIFFRTIIRHGLFPNRSSLYFYLNSMFKNISLENKNVLDIGAGNGLYGFFMSVRGAKNVTCIEPEGDGSNSTVLNKFNRLRDELGLKNIKFSSKSFQEFDPGKEKFDIILLHNSINHLDENACMVLDKDQDSQSVYKELFSKISSISNKGSSITLCDCSNRNFFSDLGISNPFAKNIEWSKHQKPELWIKLLSKSGFGEPHLRWNSFKRLGNPGKYIFANKLMAYFFTSHFCVTMKKI